MTHILKLKTFQFSVSIINFTTKLPKKNTYWIISDQIIRSSTSIGANINEATSASSRKEFIRYYEIALRSAYETNYWLKLLNEINGNYRNNVLSFEKEVIEIKKLLTASILTLKRNKK